MEVAVYYNRPVPVTLLSNTFSSTKSLRLGKYNGKLFEDAQDEGIATVITNHHRYSYTSLTDTQASVSYLQRIPWAAA
jgi:hypothetical protein